MSLSRKTYRKRHNHNITKDFIHVLTTTIETGNNDPDAVNMDRNNTQKPSPDCQKAFDDIQKPLSTSRSKPKRRLSSGAETTDQPKPKRMLPTPSVEHSTTDSISSRYREKEPGVTYTETKALMIKAAETFITSKHQTSMIERLTMDLDSPLKDHIFELLPMILQHVVGHEPRVHPYYQTGMINKQDPPMTRQEGTVWLFRDRNMIKADNIDLSFLRVSKTFLEIGADFYYGTKAFHFYDPSACS